MNACSNLMKRKLDFLCIVFLILILSSLFFINIHKKLLLDSLKSDISFDKSRLYANNLSICFTLAKLQNPQSIYELPFKLNQLYEYYSKDKYPLLLLNCKYVLEKLIDTYEINLHVAPQFERIPRKKAQKLSYKFFGKLFSDDNFPMIDNSFYNQAIIHVKNKKTFEYTSFNILRGMRKHQSSTHNEAALVNFLAQNSSSNCQFCEYMQNTILDELNINLSNSLAFLFSNAFKIDQWHAIIAPKIHNPTLLTYDHITSMLNLSIMWMDKASAFHFNQTPAQMRLFPMISWDSLPSGGASQIHPHFQCFLSQSHYYGKFYNFVQNILRSTDVRDLNFEDDLPEIAKIYQNYVDDLILIYTFLGLAFPCPPGTEKDLPLLAQTCVMLVNLNAIKEYDIIVIYKPYAANDNHGGSQFASFTRALYTIIELYRNPIVENHQFMDTFTPKYSFSATIIFPPVMPLQAHNQLTFPTLARFVVRPTVTNQISDFSAIEMFIINNVVYDPYKLAHQLYLKLAQ